MIRTGAAVANDEGGNRLEERQELLFAHHEVEHTSFGTYWDSHDLRVQDALDQFSVDQSVPAEGSDAPDRVLDPHSFPRLLVAEVLLHEFRIVEVEEADGRQEGVLAATLDVGALILLDGDRDGVVRRGVALVGVENVDKELHDRTAEQF